MKEKFENRNLTGTIAVKMDEAKGVWHGDKAVVCNAMIDICLEYQRAGYTMTLRQLYYQLVARDIIPNHDKVYSKISSIKDDLVYSGKIDWDVFEDRVRVPIVAYFEDDVKSALQRTIDCYALNKQDGQPTHIEVWTEKDAISSILKRVTDRYTVRLVINKGYTSSTAIYGAYQRFLETMEEGKKVKVLYFGDHDPSGIDMIRDIEERLMFMFTKGESFKDSEYLSRRISKWWDDNGYTLYDVAYSGERYESVIKLMDTDSEKLDNLFDEGKLRMFIKEHELFEVIPVGLTMEQIKLYKPPHNPAKITDPRANGYIKKYGPVSWEVDALRPEIMVTIVKDAIEDNLDYEMYQQMLSRERAEIDSIKSMINSLDEDE